MEDGCRKMSYLKLLQLILFLAKMVTKFVDRRQIEAAEAKGEDMGELRAFLTFRGVLDEKVAQVESARAERAVAGRMRVDPADDPNNRKTDRPKGAAHREQEDS